jgi:hypothetical protein
MTSLLTCQTEITNTFNAGDNELTSLVGGPNIVGLNYVVSNNKISSLSGVPSKIGGYLDLGNNPLTSLKGINKLKEMRGMIYIEDCPITSHILGVFFIKGCDGLIDLNGNIALANAVKIVNRHIGNGRAGILACTNELIESELDDFAQI